VISSIREKGMHPVLAVSAEIRPNLVEERRGEERRGGERGERRERRVGEPRIRERIHSVTVGGEAYHVSLSHSVIRVRMAGPDWGRLAH
jgi:hypothetical protein